MHFVETMNINETLRASREQKALGRQFLIWFLVMVAILLFVR
jgi:hypothetical protein